MKNIKTLPLLTMIAMVILSFTNLFGLNIAGAAIFVGVIFFFVNKAVEKEPYKGSGLDFSSIRNDLKDIKVWFWVVLPLVMGVITLVVAKLFLPEYIEYEIIRAGGFVAIELSLLSIVQFFIFALGEEIAWRAFFQKQLNKSMSITSTVLISSLLFSLGHFKAGDFKVVAFSMLSVFINSILYGVVFHKTNNAWISTISHFISNVAGVIILMFI